MTFWIFDFGFNTRDNPMNGFPLKSLSGNRKSVIRNPKLAGILAILFALVIGGARAQAQQPKKLFRIGYLSARNAAMESARAEGIRLALHELGYTEGQNIAIEYRYAEGKRDQFSDFAAQLVRLKVDVIVVAGGDPEIRVAKNATTTVPIIMVGPGLDPVEAGFVESLAHPGGNITGVTSIDRELGGKRLEVLKEAVPKITRVALLYQPAITVSVLDVKEVLPVARGLGLTVRSWEIREAAGFEPVFTALNKERPDGLYVPPGPLFSTNQKRIVDFALKSRLPAMYFRKDFVDAGGLMSYGADLADSYRRVAYYVDKILKGAKPAEIPVEQPTKFEFVVNLKTAKQIGLNIPPNVLARADRMIK